MNFHMFGKKYLFFSFFFVGFDLTIMNNEASCRIMIEQMNSVCVLEYEPECYFVYYKRIDDIKGKMLELLPCDKMFHKLNNLCSIFYHHGGIHELCVYWCVKRNIILTPPNLKCVCLRTQALYTVCIFIWPGLQYYFDRKKFNDKQVASVELT